MSTTYSLFLLFLFLLVSAANIALGYWTAIFFRAGSASGDAVAGALPAGLKLTWLKLPSLGKLGGKSKAVAAAPVEPVVEAAPETPPSGPAPLEGTSLACLKLSEMIATFAQSVYEQDLLLREFLENPGDAERAKQLAEGGPKFLERHLKRFNQAAAKLDAITQTDSTWLEGKQAVRSALASLLADAKQAVEEFNREIEGGAALPEALTKCMQGGVDRALALRGQLERGVERLVSVDPGFARLPVETLEEKGKHLFGRAWINHRLQSDFDSLKKFHIATLDLIDFRGFNHQKGYAVGAVILDGVDKLLHDNLKAGEWCYRIDGDRWYFLLTTGDQEKAAARIDHLRQLIAAARFDWAKKEFVVQMRAAITLGSGGDRLDKLEIALREAITSGKRENLMLTLAEGVEMKPLQMKDLGMAPVTISL